MKKWSILTPTFLLLIVLSVSDCQRSRFSGTTEKVPDSEPTPKPVHVRQAWIQMERDIKSASGKLIRKALPVLMKEIYKKEISAGCLGTLMGFTKGLREAKLWAYRLLDSSGRFPEGFLQGTLIDLGNYQECMEIKVNETKMKFQGQYCTVNIVPPLPERRPFMSAHIMPPELANISAPDTAITYILDIIHNLHVVKINIGICTPSKCTREDVDKLADIIPEQLGMDWKFNVVHCEVSKPVEFNASQLVVLYILGVVCLLVTIGTIVAKIWSSEEMEEASVKSTLFHVMKSFSVMANGKKLSDYCHPQSDLGFVYGIIVAVFLWNVISNTFMQVSYDVASNFVEALHLLQQMFYEVAINRILPLQTLFFIHGFIIAYRFLKTPEREFNFLKFLLGRYFRYTPTYALVIALVILTPTWGSGPSWSAHMDPLSETCSSTWWYNILYINNFMDSEKVCLPHTWVIAVAAQLHVIAAVILIPMKIRPKIGLMLNFVLVVASLASVALTNVYYDLPPNEMTAILHEKDRNFYAEHSYHRVYTQVGIFCSGIFVGYFLAKHPNVKISTKLSCCLWICTLTGLISSFCVVHEWSKGNIPSPLLSALYTTFSKIAETAFMSWVTIAFMTGHSGGAKDILGWRPFAFLARLTFIAYIFHVPIIKMIMNFKKSPVFICEFEIFCIVLLYTAGSYIVSYILYIFFEAPFISLTDVIRNRCKVRTFTRTTTLAVPISEKPVLYLEKPCSSNKSCLNSMEKGKSCVNPVEKAKNCLNSMERGKN